jgi:hypothetical protein
MVSRVILKRVVDVMNVRFTKDIYYTVGHISIDVLCRQKNSSQNFKKDTKMT